MKPPLAVEHCRLLPACRERPVARVRMGAGPSVLVCRAHQVVAHDIARSLSASLTSEELPGAAADGAGAAAEPEPATPREG